MALVLKRITDPYECKKCSITGKLLAYGDEYYEDDVDGKIIDFEYYYDTKLEMKIRQAEEKIDEAMDRFSYQQILKQKERQFLQKTIFDRPLADQDCLSWSDYYQSKLLNNNESPSYINNDNDDKGSDS